MYKTLYIRCKMPDGERLRGPLESLVYALVPNDEPISADRILFLVDRHLEHDPDLGHVTQKAVRDAIAELSSRGALQEIHGLRIEKCVREAASLRKDR